MDDLLTPAKTDNEQLSFVKEKAGKTPEWYRCHVCGVTGYKLWHELDQLICAPCSSKSQGVDVTWIDDCGRYNDKGKFTDRIGKFRPAIPLGDNKKDGFTTEESDVPTDKYHWWINLPSVPPENLSLKIKG